MVPIDIEFLDNQFHVLAKNTFIAWLTLLVIIYVVLPREIQKYADPLSQKTHLISEAILASNINIQLSPIILDVQAKAKHAMFSGSF
eukprot:CAMPEP_0172483956 /NCGR_PEP_ID=MMETSP1066-20121228/11201_1 /TAXON_ID=671091 /ORGANISM="Coscinodiscus wailesii, Strain CCMP2513" /LENGTH=86 /DNA_ID=CAMNT_0013248169 /DNA_START=71 /DNA_END=328 /DNA_ORIENTATION=+